MSEADVLYLVPFTTTMHVSRHPLIGAMMTPVSQRLIPDDLPWAADCGIGGGDGDRYLTWLGGPHRNPASALFAVAPDVLGDPTATLARALPFLDPIRALGYPVAYVAQDGFDPETVPWDRFDVLFLGGRPLATKTTPIHERSRLTRLEWKRAEGGGWAAIREAKRRGKRVHVGRVNGGPFLRQLAAAGVDSADGTSYTFKAMRSRVHGWLDGLAVQPPLGLEAVS